MDKKKKFNKWLSIVLIGLSIVGFTVTTQKKENAAFFEKRGSTSEFNFEIELPGNSEYVISYWVVDEETGFQWANVSSYAEVLINDSIVKNMTIDFSESEEQGGIKRAQNGFNYNFHPSRNTKIILNGVMKKGDYWEWKVYKDISETDNIMPGVFILLLLFSVFMLLRTRRNKQ